jgi:1,4-dihydroxy-2-naphthoate octaprenyltransferase
MTAGLEASTKLYGLFLVLAYMPLAIGIGLSLLPAACAIALFPLLLASRSYLGVRQNAHDVPSLLPFMGMNVAVNLLTPVLLAIGLFIG